MSGKNHGRKIRLPDEVLHEIADALFIDGQVKIIHIGILERKFMKRKYTLPSGRVVERSTNRIVFRPAKRLNDRINAY